MSNNNELEEIIKKQIRLEGPLSVASYMGLCLTHSKFGYYKNCDVLGSSGDFITAPEISQMFGEFIGLFIAQSWLDLGSPKAFDLVELGPGRGTLLSDAFRVLEKVDGLINAMSLNLLETGSEFKELQKEKLGKYNPIWVNDIEEISENNRPLIIIANEFFDALPIKQFQKQNGNWYERAIGLTSDKLSFGLAPNIIPKDALPQNIVNAPDNSVWEVSFASLILMEKIASLVAARRGTFLAIDYGYNKTQTGETFQAIKNHEYADPLNNPGKADLTAHVDFEALQKSALKAGANVFKLKTQGEFLSLLGMKERSEQLASANPKQADEIKAATNRLISKEEMGELFKVLCVSSKDFTPFPFGNT